MDSNGLSRIQLESYAYECNSMVSHWSSLILVESTTSGRLTIDPIWFERIRNDSLIRMCSNGSSLILTGSNGFEWILIVSNRQTDVPQLILADSRGFQWIRSCSGWVQWTRTESHEFSLILMDLDGLVLLVMHSNGFSLFPMASDRFEVALVAYSGFE